MQVTLRQAHKIVDKLNAKIKSISVSTNIEINIWQATTEEAVKAMLDTAGRQIKEQTERLARLASIRHDVRALIAAANQKRVNELIAARKLTLDTISSVRSLIEMYRPNQHFEAAEIVAQAAANRANTSAFHRSETITVSLVDAKELAEANKSVDALQLQLEQIEDALTAANSDRNNLVNLTEFAYALREEGIVI